jgi:hypothetical protein
MIDMNECQKCRGKVAHVWVDKKKLSFLEKTPEQIDQLVSKVRVMAASRPGLGAEEAAKAILGTYSEKKLLCIPLCAECEKDLGKDWLDKNVSFTPDEFACREVHVT